MSSAHSHFAIVDEVDSILIDEARTPLIISGPTDQTTDLYTGSIPSFPQLKPEHDYTIEEKKDRLAHGRGTSGSKSCWAWTTSTTCNTHGLVHHVVKALQAYSLYKRDVDCGEGRRSHHRRRFTGRLMPGRRWSDGLHQAVETKEGVKIANENQTLASVTFQNYFPCTRNWRA